MLKASAGDAAADAQGPPHAQRPPPRSPPPPAAEPSQAKAAAATPPRQEATWSPAPQPGARAALAAEGPCRGSFAARSTAPDEGRSPRSPSAPAPLPMAASVHDSPKPRMGRARRRWINLRGGSRRLHGTNRQPQSFVGPPSPDPRSWILFRLHSARRRKKGSGEIAAPNVLAAQADLHGAHPGGQRLLRQVLGRTERLGLGLTRRIQRVIQGQDTDRLQLQQLVVAAKHR